MTTTITAHKIIAKPDSLQSLIQILKLLQAWGIHLDSSKTMPYKGAKWGKEIAKLTIDSVNSDGPQFAQDLQKLGVSIAQDKVIKALKESRINELEILGEVAAWARKAYGFYSSPLTYSLSYIPHAVAYSLQESDLVPNDVRAFIKDNELPKNLFLGGYILGTFIDLYKRTANQSKQSAALSSHPKTSVDSMYILSQLLELSSLSLFSDLVEPNRSLTHFFPQET